MSDTLRTPGAALLAALAREVREPLQSMTAWLALIAARGEDPTAVRRALTALEQIVRQQAELADDLLEVSRIAAGRVGGRRERVDATAAVRDCVERHRQQARGEGVELRFDDSGAPVPVVADAARLRQAIDKLLRAAIRRTPSQRRVSVRVAIAGSFGEIVVSDAGDDGAPDIPALSERLDTGAVPRPGRSGLGLVLARQLIEGQGGEMSTTAGPASTGATFAIRLPVWRDGTATLRFPELPPERMLEDLRLLVVDDDPTVLEALSQALVAYGARVAVAPSAAAALDRLHRETFDGVCSDLDMPGGSGLTLARALRVRETAGRRHLPLVAVTGQAGEEPERTAREAGFDAYLVKPIAVATLARCLQMLIDRERGQAAPPPPVAGLGK